MMCGATPADAEVNVEDAGNLQNHSGTDTKKERLKPAESDNNNAKRTPQPGSTKNAPLYVSAQCDNNTSPPRTEEGWWHKLLTDPNATLSGALVIFTSLLAVFAFWQMWVVRDTARKQLRAHVGLVEWKFEISDDIANQKPAVSENEAKIYCDFLCATVKNFGATAATNVLYIGGMAWTAFGGKISKDDPCLNHRDKNVIDGSGYFVSRFMLSPGQQETGKTPINDQEAIDAIKNARLKKATIYVHGRVYYRDIYGRAWRTKFCHVWEPWHPPGPRFVPYEIHNGEDQERFEDQT